VFVVLETDASDRRRVVLACLLVCDVMSFEGGLAANGANDAIIRLRRAI
jgi:hypothetical protein